MKDQLKKLVYDNAPGGPKWNSIVYIHPKKIGHITVFYNQNTSVYNDGKWEKSYGWCLSESECYHILDRESPHSFFPKSDMNDFQNTIANLSINDKDSEMNEVEDGIIRITI